MAQSNQKSKNVLKKLPSEKKIAIWHWFEMVTTISVYLKSESLLRKETYCDFEKSLKPLKNGVTSKWKAHHWNQHGRKLCTGKLQSTSSNDKENNCIASVARICLLLFFFFFFFRPRPHLRVFFFINSTICKCDIALKQHFWCHFLSVKALKYKTGTIIIVMFQNP